MAASRTRPLGAAASSGRTLAIVTSPATISTAWRTYGSTMPPCATANPISTGPLTKAPIWIVRMERDRRGKQPALDQLGQQRGARRSFERRGGRHDHHRAIEHGQARLALEARDREQDRARERHQLEHHHQPLAVVGVGGGAADQVEHERGNELRETDHPEMKRRARDLVDLPRHRRPQQRERHAGEEAAGGERAESARTQQRRGAERSGRAARVGGGRLHHAADGSGATALSFVAL